MLSKQFFAIERYDMNTEIKVTALLEVRISQLQGCALLHCNDQ